MSFKNGFNDYLRVAYGASQIFTSYAKVISLNDAILDKIKNSKDKNALIVLGMVKNAPYTCGAGLASLFVVLQNVSDSVLSKPNSFFKTLVEKDNSLKALKVSPWDAGNYIFGLLNATGSKANRDNFLKSLKKLSGQISKSVSRYTKVLDRTSGAIKTVAPQSWVPELINPIAKGLSPQSWILLGVGAIGFYFWKIKK